MKPTLGVFHIQVFFPVEGLAFLDAVVLGRYTNKCKNFQKKLRVTSITFSTDINNCSRQFFDEKSKKLRDRKNEIINVNQKITEVIK